MRKIYQIGGNLLSPYFEYLERDVYTTPKYLRDQGLFLDLPYERISMVNLMNSSELVDTQGIVLAGRRVDINALGLTPAFLIQPSDPSMNDVIGNLANAWRQSDINAGLLLSPEGRESVDTMTEALRKIANCASALRQKDFGGAVRHLNHMPRSHVKRAHRKFDQGDLSGSFLSLHLGWTPIVQDLYNASDLVSPTPAANRLRATRKGFSGIRSTAKVSYPVQYTFKDNRRITLTGDVVKPPSFTERFGLGNAFSIVWERVPLSFVADYFLPIGPAIDNLYFISQARFEKMWLKIFREHKYTVRVKAGTVIERSPYTGQPIAILQEDLFMYRTEERFYKRSNYALSFTDPVRSLVNDFDNELSISLTQLTTMSALAHQKLLKLKG